jgi:hypothetical protein
MDGSMSLPTDYRLGGGAGLLHRTAKDVLVATSTTRPAALGAGSIGRRRLP